MWSRRSWPAILLILAATGLGCAALDRESYSLVIRKRAHQYEPAEKKPALEPATDGEAAADTSSFVRHDLDALIDRAAPRLEAFRPFAYCHLHESSHAFESLLAVILAPVEYPTAMTGNFVYLTADSAVKLLMAPLDALLPPPEKPLTFEERRKPPNR